MTAANTCIPKTESMAVSLDLDVNARIANKTEFMKLVKRMTMNDQCSKGDLKNLQNKGKKANIMVMRILSTSGNEGKEMKKIRANTYTKVIRKNMKNMYLLIGLWEAMGNLKDSNFKGFNFCWHLVLLICKYRVYMTNQFYQKG